MIRIVRHEFPPPILKNRKFFPILKNRKFAKILRTRRRSRFLVVEKVHDDHPVRVPVPHIHDHPVPHIIQKVKKSILIELLPRPRVKAE